VLVSPLKKEGVLFEADHFDLSLEKNDLSLPGAEMSERRNDVESPLSAVSLDGRSAGEEEEENP